MSLQKMSWVMAFTIVFFAIPAQAEMYVAAQVGANLPQNLTNVRGIEDSSGVRVSNLDLRNQVVFGVKVGGYFPESWNWLGLEGEFYHTDSDIKRQSASLSGPIPDVSRSAGRVRRTDIAINTFALNTLVRYPGTRWQPYIGIGVGLNIYSLDTRTGLSENRFGPTLNLLAGVRAFVTKRVATFIEYKHNRGSVEFPDAGFEGNYRTNMVLAGVSYHWK